MQEEATISSESVVSDSLYSFVPDKQLSECLGLYSEESSSSGITKDSSQKRTVLEVAGPSYASSPKRSINSIFSQVRLPFGATLYFVIVENMLILSFNHSGLFSFISRLFFFGLQILELLGASFFTKNLK